jgi:predicted NAD-dependent protein-ADP-ribosyltransferase YbiA (DUF1768 family)
MVLSNIHKTINYPEMKTINNEDKGALSVLYELQLQLSDGSIDIIVVLGKPKYTYQSKNVIYFPIYVVSKNTESKIRIKSQIGVFEIESSRVLSIYDDDNDIDLTQLDTPLLYSFVNKKYLEKANSKPELFKETVLLTTEKEKEKEKEKEIVEEPQEEESDSDDIIHLKVRNSMISKSKEDIKETLETGIFSVNKNQLQPTKLQEETEKMANEERKQYKESASNHWISKFLKNNHYHIVETSANGDCLFDTIRIAFESIGKHTTIKKLRAIVANELTEDIYRETRNVFLMFEGEIKENMAELASIKKAIQVYKKRIQQTNAQEEKRELLKELEKLKDQYTELSNTIKYLKDSQSEFVGDIREYDTLDKYREYIQTSRYWADAWSISTLENILNIKIIILDESAYDNKSLDNIFQCGEINKEIQERGSFTPDFYIIASYSGNHYRLISYKRKRIFSFSEIPYDLKVLAINKCLEKNAGPYYLIQDFRHLQSNLGIQLLDGSEEEEEDMNVINDYFEPDTVFEFNIQSMDAKPGKGSKEKIPIEKVSQFVYLTKVKDWRRKLDDKSMVAPFKLDGHRWASVFHYMSGCKFKKGFPDFYVQFSLDSASDLANDIDLAKHAADTGKIKDRILRPKGVKKDVDFVVREDEEREEAIRAKFTQNEDMKNILIGTRRALLNHAIRRNPSEADVILMKIRNELL